MDRKEQVEFCKICTKRKFSREKGLLCGLTNKYAVFEIDCPDFEEDEIAVQLELEKKMAYTGDYQSGDSFDFQKNKQNGLLTLLIGIIVLVFTAYNFEEIGVLIIPFGAIIYGARQYYRGYKQEEVWGNEKLNNSSNIEKNEHRISQK